MRNSFIVFLVVTFFVPIVASEGSAPAEEGPVYEVTPQLELPAGKCREEWVAELGEPSEEVQEWRRKTNHGIYRIGIGDTLLARIELLSGANPPYCDSADPDWKHRQTLVHVTYFLADGGTHEVLYEFLEDDVFYSRSPEIYAAGGIIVLQGKQFDGTDAQITLELELLRELYGDVAPPREPAKSRLMAVFDRSLSPFFYVLDPALGGVSSFVYKSS